MNNKVRNLEKQISGLIENAMVLRQQLLESFPERTYYDEILAHDAPVSTAVIAEDYGIKADDFNELLGEMGIVVRNSREGWLLNQDLIAYGYAFVGKTSCEGNNCNVMGWTQKGRLFLYSELKQNGILPVIEEDGCE